MCRTMIRRQRSQNAAAVVISEVVGVVFRFSQLDADFFKRLVQAGIMQRLCIGNDAVEIEDESLKCRHRNDGKIMLEVSARIIAQGSQKEGRPTQSQDLELQS